jgi:pimeloyl-ACP methyl ester carboxylesterase
MVPGRRGPKPRSAEDGCALPAGTSEKVFLEVNGVRQGMFLRGTYAAAPVLLFLHGGLPEYFLTARYPTGLENVFTVAWWEQRGAGLSYHPDIPPESMTLEQFIADTVSVTGYLRHRFDTEKIYLMGHSGGTFIGLQAAARRPELYAAYVGVAQIVHQRRSERLAYEYLLARYREIGDARMVRRLEAAPVTMTGGTPAAYLAVRDRAMHRIGVGTTRDMRSVPTGIFWPSLLSPEYTAREKLGMWRGKHSSGVSPLWEEMLATDLATAVTELAVPTYFFHGIHDHTVDYHVAKDYLAALKAPLKGFYSFERSAHSPILEEPERARRILLHDVLSGTNSLADYPSA